MNNIKHISCIALTALCFTISAQVSLNEVCSKNGNSLDVNGNFPDWIELYNAGVSAVNLQGYKLSDDKDEPSKWTFPSISISGGSYLLVLTDGEDRLDDYAHTNFKLSNGGENLLLSNTSGELLDEVDVPSLSEDITYSKIDGIWKRTFASPGEANEGNELPKIDKPTFSESTGIYTENLQLAITAPGGNSRVEYYINDLKGLQKSETNTASLGISSTMMVCARADADDKEQSDFQCHTYIVGTDHDLPVLSILANQKDIFDPEEGLFEMGPDAETEWPYLGANFWSDRSEEVYFQYFNNSSSSIFDGHADLEMHGGRQARTHPQKTFKLLAKEKYDQEFFDFPFFSSQPEIEKYKRLVVRNASGDYNVAHCRDGFLHNHVTNHDLNIDGTAYQPIAVYINGSYYGLMGLREKVDKYYTETHYATQNIDLLEEEVDVLEGDSSTFKNHLKFLTDNDLTTDANYATAEMYFDISSLIDYFHTQVANSNADWPRNNIKFWREKKQNAKWRYIMFDLDAALGRFGWTEADDPMLSAKLNTSEETSVFVTVMKALLKNEKFKIQFYNRHQDLLNTTFSTPIMLTAFESLTNDISLEMSRHLQKWPSLTFSDWEDVELNKIKSYINDRPNIAMDQMEEYFNLDGRYNLSLTSNESDMTFKLNSLNDVAVGFEGQYFDNIPIKVSPNSEAGMQFKYWEITTNDETTTNSTEELEISFTENTELRAVFEGVSTTDLVQSFTMLQNNLHFSIYLKGKDPLQYEVLDLDGKTLLSGVKTNTKNGLQSLDLEFETTPIGLKIVHLRQGIRSYAAKILITK